MWLNGASVAGNWTVWRLPLDTPQLSRAQFGAVASGDLAMPSLYRGWLTIDGAVADTFVRLAGWSKGIVWVNGHNLGRHWEAVGPQHTLFLPAPFLHLGANELLVLELDQAPANVTVTFQTQAQRNLS